MLIKIKTISKTNFACVRLIALDLKVTQGICRMSYFLYLTFNEWHAEGLSSGGKVTKIKFNDRLQNYPELLTSTYC